MEGVLDAEEITDDLKKRKRGDEDDVWHESSLGHKEEKRSRKSEGNADSKQLPSLTGADKTGEVADPKPENGTGLRDRDWNEEYQVLLDKPKTVTIFVGEHK